jgi:hypothetical protein
VRRARAAAFAAALVASALAVPGGCAQAATPQGVVGHGRITINFTTPEGKAIGLTGDAAFEQRDDAFRLDMLSATLSGVAPSSTQLLPPGGLTLTIDRKTQRFVIWSADRRLYYWGTLPKPPSPLGPSTPASPASTPAPAPSGSPGPDRGLFSGFKDLKAFSFGIDMSGHGTTDGHPSTGFTYRLHREGNDGKTFDLNGQLQTADDLKGLPLLFTATADAAASVAFSAKLRIELTSYEKRDPPKLDFLVPAGYKSAESPVEVIFPGGAPPFGMPH